MAQAAQGLVKAEGSVGSLLRLRELMLCARNGWEKT